MSIHIPSVPHDIPTRSLSNIFVVLTQAEYDALPSSKLTDDKFYYLSDTKKIVHNGIQYGASEASEIGFSNSGTGLSSSNVQDAITEVAQEFFKSNFAPFTGDLNELTAIGRVWCMDTCQHLPVANFGHCLSYGDVQQFVVYGSADMYVRERTNGNWTEWKLLQMAHLCSNRSLLDNPWFTVNQREQNSYSGSYLYTVDRWYVTDGTMTATVSSDHVNLSATTTAKFRQTFENVLPSRTYTVSAKVKGQGSIRCLNGGGSVVSEASFNTQNVSIISATNTADIKYVEIRVASGTNCDVYAVKLELGSVSTLANDVAPNYAEELAKCQRYFYRHKASGGYPISLMGFPESGGARFCPCIIPPVPMRTVPSLSINGTWVAWDGQTAINMNAIIINESSIDGNDIPIISLRCNVATTLQMYRGYVLTVRGDTTAYMDFSADL